MPRRRAFEKRRAARARARAAPRSARARSLDRFPAPPPFLPFFPSRARSASRGGSTWTSPTRYIAPSSYSSSSSSFSSLLLLHLLLLLLPLLLLPPLLSRDADLSDKGRLEAIAAGRLLKVRTFLSAENVPSL